MPTIISVDDPGDPRLEPYRDIKERDLVGRHGLFVAEGKVVLEKLAASGSFELLSLLVAAKRVETLAPLIAGLPQAVPVYAAAQPVIDRVAGFPLHRGILGIGRRTANPDGEALLAQVDGDGDVLLLSAIANHDNMGGIFRNAAAFGAKAVLLDSDCCDPLYRKAIRVSVGATLLVPFARLAPGEDAVALLGRHGFAPLALSPAGTMPLSQLTPGARNALILGAEGPGLADDLLRRAVSVRIPMARGFDSLNVATTSGIVLHHLASARERPQPLPGPAESWN